MREYPVILVIDDSAHIVRLVEMILDGSIACEIVSANCGEKGIKAAHTYEPDLILLDISMPDIDGYTVCKRLKDDEKFRDTPILFLSSMTNKQNIVQGLKKGAVDYISKPFYPQELVARVEIHIQLKQHKQLIQKQLLENNELLQVLCHDLANPIGAMDGIMQFAEMDEQMLLKYKSMLRGSIDNMIEIISMVRNFKAINDGKHKIHLTPISLHKCIQESLQTLDHRLVQKNITVKSSVPEDIHVMAESTSLRNSVINNLLTNAIKFSFEGDEISITTEIVDEKRVTLSIRDNGIGMPESIRENLFNMNVATSRPGTNKESGTGYGMPLVKKFISQYDGEISVESVEMKNEAKDHGTTITLTFNKANNE